MEFPSKQSLCSRVSTMKTPVNISEDKSRPFWCHTKDNSLTVLHSGIQSRIWDSPNWQFDGLRLCSHIAYFRQECHNSKCVHFWVIGIERNVCRYTFNRCSVITQFAKLAAGEQLCRRCTHRKLQHFKTSEPSKPLRTVRPIYRTGVPLPSRCCILYIFSASMSTGYFKHAAHSPFFSSKCRLFHNATFFGFCIIHILHTCAKI